MRLRSPRVLLRRLSVGLARQQWLVAMPVAFLAALGVGFMIEQRQLERQAEDNRMVCEAQNDLRRAIIDDARVARDTALADPRIAAAFPNLTPDQIEELARESFERKRAAFAPIDCP